MIKFFIILLFYIVFSASIFMGFGSENGNYIRSEGKAASWNKDKQLVLNNVIKWGAKIVAVAILIVVIVPMLKDIPYAISNKTVSVTGCVSWEHSFYGTRFIRQSIEIESQTVCRYFSKPLLKGDCGTIKYLPNSKFVMDVIK